MGNNRKQNLFRACCLCVLPAAVVLAALLTGPSGADTPESKAAPSIFAGSKPKAGAEKPVATQPAVVKPEASTNAQPAEVDNRPTVNRLDVTPEPGQSLEDAYFEYFSQNRVEPKVVRAKVRRVANEENGNQNFEEAVAILRAAIRSGQIQSWMYEALGLMMEAARMPRDEIERTLMSAADFAKTPQELIYLADYMDRLKFRKRSLEILRLVSEKAPAMTDPYIRGLEFAKELKDDDAIRWASLGILRQEWPQGQRSIRDKARYAAMLLLGRLRKGGTEDKEAADLFASELQDALVRDVVIQVAWAGDADVDMMVEEPGGTVCSYRQPRTASGGVLVGDLTSKLSRSSGEGFSETYVCPQGFSGTYRVLLRQVWGRIPAGKLTVDVWTHGGTSKSVRFHKVVTLDDESGALVTFDLDKGRRRESLQDLKISNDVAGQLAANRSVLAKQINALANDKIYSQQTGSEQQDPLVVSQNPTRDPRNRVAGFRPDIVVLPTGATMSVNAVISADRRYVRITALPFFSGVARVTQFNLTQGVTGVDNDLAQADIDIDGGGLLDAGPLP